MNRISEDDLHAYADGLLPAGRRAEVEAWLAAHAEDAARVQAWAAQNRSLHAAFDEVLNEPLPLQLVRAASGQRTQTTQWYRAAAAVFIVAGVGVLGYGLGLRSAEPAAQYATLPQAAAIAHVVYSPEVRHPVEVEAQHADHLVAWLSKRLGHALRAPDFTAQGFDLLGGRLLPGETGPVAQFMYQDGLKRRITLYVRRDAAKQAETSFRHAREDGIEVFYWVDHGLGYALSGNVDKAEMGRLADAAYHQISP
ncbi:anti-sigma factor [Betaproteobacteria bacterium SCN2]|jgi:anti-sigma factor RsiW|nr:anti-sigma factor [Betaproteobacteria bacterium SCN2]